MTENCSKVWNKYDDKTKVNIGMSVECLNVCEKLMDNVIANNPIEFKLEYIDALKRIYEAFSPEELGQQHTLRGEAEEVLALLDNLNHKDKATGDTLKPIKSIFWEDAEDKLSVFDKNESGLHNARMEFADFKNSANVLLISLKQLLLMIFLQSI